MGDNQDSDFDQSMSEEDTTYMGDTWSEEGDDYGHEPDIGELEPDPPDQDRDRSSLKRWYAEEDEWGETDQESNTDESGGESWRESEEEKPWCEIPYSGYEEELHEETDSQISLEEPELRDETWYHEDEFEENSGAESDHELDDDLSESFEHEDESETGRNQPRYIKFSGHHQGPEAYLRWEQDMEDWFSSNQISEEEKTSYAEDTLTEDAFRIWEREAHIRLEYEEPDPSWEEMKQFLYQEFVEDVDNRRQYNLRIYTNPKPRRWILATKPKTTSKKACCPKPKEVLQSTIEKKIVAKELVGAKEVRPELNLQVVARTLSTNPLLEPHDKLEQCKSSKASNVVDTMCYRCHRRGHFARVCPSRKTKPTSSLDSEIVETREVECVEPKLDNSNASIMHLLLSKFDEAGTRVDEKMPTQEATPSMDTKQKLIRHEEMSKPKQAKVSDHVLKLITDDPNTLMIHLICPKGVEKDLGVKEK